MATAAASESFSNAQKSNSNHKNAKDDDDREMIAFPPSTIISFSLSFQLNGNQLLLERKWHVRNRFKSRDWNK